MLTIKNLTIKNFLSTGNVCQSINFTSNDLTLILGENLDLGGNGSRNGVGKTTMIQAISYALFGASLNGIKKDNLINRTNGKAMLVTLEFSSKSIDYKIERGRKPNVLKFFVNNTLKQATDESQGDSRETQLEIERVIQMSSDLFKQIVSLNTYNEPFLAMRSNDQRQIIEQLLGVTLLSEKAEKLKEQIKITKDSIQEESFNVKTIEETNKRVYEQIDSLKRRQRLWNAKHEEDLNKLIETYTELSKLDIEEELSNHKKLQTFIQQRKQVETRQSLLARQTTWSEKRDSDVKQLSKQLNQMSEIDIALELDAHKKLASYHLLISELARVNQRITQIKSSSKKLEVTHEKLVNEINQLKNHKCYACGQDFHDANHDSVLSEKEKALVTTLLEIDQLSIELTEQESLIVEVGDKPNTFYKTESEAFKHQSVVEQLENAIQSKLQEDDPFKEHLSEYPEVILGEMPITFYDTEAEAISHSSLIDSIEHQIEQKSNESDPYSEQISEMVSNGIQEISFDKLNELNKVFEHQKFLLDLLTNKDSFVRKKIIDQNLAYLNTRLTFYLEKTGLPHQVEFKNDLSIEISEHGRELDFGNLSRGESNRVIMSLSWAFRDVFENLYQPINVMFVDEILDAGLDSSGVENSITMLKDMARNRNKSIWLVSHKDELINRVNSILKVVKTNGFTEYLTDQVV